MAGLSATLISAVVLVLSFPKFDLGWLAWIGLVPLLAAIRGRSLKASFGLCLLFGMLHVAGVFYWINLVKGFSASNFSILMMYYGIYYGFFGLLLSFISRNLNISFVYSAPVLWVSLEFFRAHVGFLSLPWPILGHSQYRYLNLIQISSVTGAYGVSFLIVMVNALGSEVLHYSMRRKGDSILGSSGRIYGPVLMTLLVFGVSLAFGHFTLDEPVRGKTAKVAVIQGNIPQHIKWDPNYRKWAIERHISLSETASAAERSELIVWPESSVPGSLRADPYLFSSVSNLAKKTGKYLLIGSAERAKIRDRRKQGGDNSNGAFLFSPGGMPIKVYKKILLLPFGEYLPWRGRFPWPSRFEKGIGELAPGKEFTVFDMNGARFGVLICWESIFPDLARRFVSQGAQFLVNMTNEAWFGDTSAPHQFLAMTVFRAVENRVGIARSANTGISAFIGPSGEIMGRVKNRGKDLFVEGFTAGELPLGPKERTFYTKYGDVFAGSNVVLVLVLLYASWTKVRNATRTAAVTL